MIIGTCTIELHLPDSTSLKDKRSIIKSLLARLHNTFNVSAAEVDKQDLWQSAVVGVAVVSNSAPHAQQVINSILNWVESSYPNIYVTRHAIEMR